MSLNPLYWLELRVRINEKRLWILSAFFVLALLAASGLIFAQYYERGSYSDLEPGTVGDGLVVASLVLQAGLIIILAPLASAGRISQEREQRTLIALLNSPATPLRIALGKLYGAWTFVLWLWSLALPFYALGALWHGDTNGSLAVVAVCNLGAGLTLATLALGLSSWFGRTVIAYLVTGALAFTWMVLLPVFGAILMNVVDKNAREFVFYATLYHHPFYPIFWFFSEALSVELDRFWTLAYCLGVWFFLMLAGMALMVAGLKRELH